MSSNSVCNHTRDKQIALPLHGRPILFSLVWLQTDVDSTPITITNSIYNKILDRDWFSARLFVT